MKRNKLLFFLSLVLITGCNVNNTSQTPLINSVNNLNAFKYNTTLKGRVDWSKGFKTKAVTEDISSYGTVSIIYPHDHATKANQTAASGITDSEGNFLITPPSSFSPLDSNVFVLEVIKRLGGINKKVLTLRTYISWDGAWKSITYPEVVINNNTTALAIISEHKNNSPVDLIETFSTVNPPVEEDVIDENHLKFVYSENDKIYVSSATKSFSPILISPENIESNREPKFLPNGSKVVWFGRTSGTFTDQCFIGNSDGTGTPVNLTNNMVDSETYSILKISPDGSKIAYVGSDFNTFKKNLYVTNTDGTGNPTKIDTTDISINHFEFSPDASKIAWTRSTDNLEDYIYIANTDGTGTPTQLTNSGSASGIKFSPDGSKIVSILFKNSKTEINLITTDVLNTPQILFDGNSTELGDVKFSPDGNKIVWRGRNSITFLNTIYIGNSDGTGSPQALSLGGNEENPVFSPDGSKVAWGGQNIQIVNSDGSGNIKTLTGGSDNRFPNFSPDGNKVFWLNGSKNNAVFVINSDGSGTELQLTANTVFDYSISFGQAIVKSDTTNVTNFVTKALEKNLDPIEVIKFEGGAFDCSVCEL